MSIVCILQDLIGGRYAPTDEEYFSFFVQKSSVHTSDKIYSDYIEIYNKTDGKVDCEVLNYIEEICAHYKEDALEFNIWFSVIYLGMVAEENRKNTQLGKRIKRLGMHQILIEGMPAKEAARFSRGKKAKELKQLCTERDF